MKYLRIAFLGGLYHEFYRPLENGLNNFELVIHNKELDATNCFWSLIFDITNLNAVIKKVKPTSPKYIAISGNPQLFIEQVQTAKKNICNPEIGPRDFFSYLETLNIVCQLYSDYEFYPYQLSIQNGFELKDFSAEKIYQECLREAKNPYLRFIKKYILPEIRKNIPNILFIEGKPSYFNMAICRILKQEFPDIHISLTNHSSEYYSINKLENHLLNNKYLFKMVDSIVLEYFTETEKLLIQALEDGEPLSKISNLIYREENKIYKTPSISPKQKYIPVIQNNNSGRELINVHLEPYFMCYWNKCTFCGINKKYHFMNSDASKNSLNISLNALKKQIGKNIKYIWFIDEAIHPSKLKQVARFFLENNLNVKWQARCRIEADLLDNELILLLKESGLKELRLGLESASLDVLQLMNKFDDDFSLTLVENICCSYSAAQISIHFPMIIGFPGESPFDRKKTYDFLQYLCKKYPLVTFNINIFNLDIRSQIAQNPSVYEIEEIYYPCEMHDFLDNILAWKRPEDADETSLSRERNCYMREILYPWMPANAYTKPHLFYRLSETIRNTLIWKSYNCSETNQISYNLQKKLTVSPTLTYNYDTNRGIYVIYNWFTHHYMIGNENIIEIFRLFEKTHLVSDIIQKLNRKDSKTYTVEDLDILLRKLFQQEYLIEI